MMCTRPKASSFGCRSEALAAEIAPTLDSWSRTQRQNGASIMEPSSSIRTVMLASRLVPSSSAFVGSSLLSPSTLKAKR